MFRKLTATILAATTLLATSPANAAMMAYMTITGQKSGSVKGGITQKGREGAIGVIATSHQILSPRDAKTGLPTGQRQHQPFVITKELDQSSPVLWKMLTTNENIPTLVVRYWAPQVKAGTGVGSEVQDYTIKLTNANIASITFHQANIRAPETQNISEYEEISFTYQKIEWTWTDGGITASDDWGARM
jgi:type VI secretion system secreted protein Hcp